MWLLCSILTRFLYCNVHGLPMHVQLQDNITLDNYEEVLANLTGAVRGAAINEQEQTTSNLAIVAAAFARSAALVNEMTIIPNPVSFALAIRFLRS